VPAQGQAAVKKLVAALFAGTLIAAPAGAQDAYPSRPITMIVPFAPGGSTDAIGRIVAAGLSEVLGQTVVVENRAGGGGSLGTATLVEAQPDGYTVGIGTASTLAINPAIYKALPFDVLEDLVPISGIVEVPNILSVNPSVEASDIASFVTYARANPGTLSYASAGNGSVGHLLGEQFKLATGADIVHVPYKGSGPALVDVVGGQVPVLYDNLPSSLPLVLDGRLRPLAVSGETRVPALPDVPTFAEAGLPDMNWMAFFGLIGPKGLPDPIIKRLNEAVGQALALPKTREMLAAQQAIVVGSSPAEFKTAIKREYDRMQGIVAAGNIKLN
jgi:tripartite-type tricarboxylate transporter receptor subunit TctC